MNYLLGATKKWFQTMNLYAKGDPEKLVEYLVFQGIPKLHG